jgi:hypothetical protein
MPANQYSDSLLMDALRGSLSNAESLGRGFTAAPVGLLGDINALGRQYITPRLPQKMQSLLESAPAAPTTEQILSNIPRVSNPRMETSGMEQLGAAMNPRGPVELVKGAGGLLGNTVNEAMVYGRGPLASITPQPMRMFIGAESPMFDKKLAFKAENMASKEKTPQEIWKETGTIKGADGQWRQEISDKESKILTGRLPTEYIDEYGDVPSWKMSQALEHPELYKAYPELKNVGGSFNSNINTDVLATYYPATDSVSYNQGKYQRGLLTDTQQQAVDSAKKKWDDFRTSDEWKSYNDALEKADESGQDIKGLVNPNLEKKARALSNEYQDLQYSLVGTGEGGVGLSPSSRTITLHELQHAIQEREGFGIGGSPSMFPSESEMNTAKIIGARLQAGETPSEAAKWVRDNLGHSTNPQVMDWAMRKDIASFPSDQKTLYKNLMGEAEARLTERRMNLTPEERRQYFPYEYDPTGAKYGLDVKPEDLLHFNQAGYYMNKGLLD